MEGRTSEVRCLSERWRSTPDCGLELKDLDDYGEFIRIVRQGSMLEASEAIQEAFIQACEKAGIPF